MIKALRAMAPWAAAGLVIGVVWSFLPWQPAAMTPAPVDQLSARVGAIEERLGKIDHVLAELIERLPPGPSDLD